MKFNDSDDLLQVMLALMPNCSIGQDADMQIIIYTNLAEVPGGMVDMDDLKRCKQCEGIVWEGACQLCDYEDDTEKN